jgi:hypothetical protein
MLVPRVRPSKTPDRISRPAPVELDLNLLCGQLETRGTSIDDNADATAMRFAEGADSEVLSEAAAAHPE